MTMLLIKALLKGHPAFRTLNFAAQRDAIHTLAAFIDAETLDAARKSTAQQETSFMFEVAHVLLLNKRREEKRPIVTPVLCVEALLHVMRMMKNAEKALFAFLKAEIVRARRHPSWEALASETDSNIWLLDLCGIPALLRSIIDKRDPAAGEKGKYALYLNEAEEHIAQTIGSWSSGSDKVEKGPSNGVCGFCHELRQENMLEGTSAERVCRLSKSEMRR
jgi:hypothetical protein